MRKQTSFCRIHIRTILAVFAIAGASYAQNLETKK